MRGIEIAGACVLFAVAYGAFALLVADLFKNREGE